MKIQINEGFSDVGIIINCPERTDAINKMVTLLQGFDNKFCGVKDDQTYFIDQDDIFYFESVEKRYFIYTAADVYSTSLRLHEIEDNFADMGFFRSSKSQVVNIFKIRSLCPDFGGRMELVMENGERLIVSRQYSTLLKERLKLK